MDPVDLLPAVSLAPHERALIRVPLTVGWSVIPRIVQETSGRDSVTVHLTGRVKIVGDRVGDPLQQLDFETELPRLPFTEFVGPNQLPARRK